MSLYEDLIDKDIIRKINVTFYDLVYDHEWMSQYFTAIEKEHIVNQQTDFITGAIGGPKNFGGRLPSNAHTHMFITEELFELRQDLLKEAFEQNQAPQDLREAWLRIDDAFKAKIVKTSPEDCQPRWTTDTILNFPNPDRFKKTG